MARSETELDDGESGTPVDGDTFLRVVREKLNELKQGDLFVHGLGEECLDRLVGANDDDDSFSKFTKIVAATIAEQSGEEMDKRERKRKRRQIVEQLKGPQRPDVEREVRLFQDRLRGGERDNSASPGTAPAAAAAASDGTGDGKLPEGSDVKIEDGPGEDDKAKIYKDGGDEHAIAGEDPGEHVNNKTPSVASGAASSEMDDEFSSSVSHHNSHKSRKKRKKDKKKKRKKDRKEKKKERKEKRKHHKRKHDEVDTSDGEDDESNVSTHGDSQNDDIADGTGAFPDDGILATKDEFEAYRERILAKIPNEVKERFRCLGFTKWGKDMLPILELSPFDVEPGPVREQWVTMFENCQHSGRPMTRLIFWYGVTWDKRGEAYSFVPKSKIVSYEDGQKKGLTELPKKIQKKLDTDKKLTKGEEQIVLGLEQSKVDSEKDRSDRIAWMMQFKEDWELFGSPAAKKDDAAIEVEEEHVEEPEPAKFVVKTDKKKKGKKLKIAKKNVKDDSTLDEDNKAAEVDEVLALADEESEAEKDDEFSAEDEVESESEDEYEEDATKKRKRKEGGAQRKSKKNKVADEKKKKKKSEMTEEERAEAHQQYLAIRRERDRIKREQKRREEAEAQGIPYVPAAAKGPSKKKLWAAEQTKFEECEEVFLPIMSRLRDAIMSQNVESVRQCMTNMHEQVNLITPPFIKAHGLGMLIKQTRKKFEEDHGDVKILCKQLTGDLKRVYAEKEPNVPDGFEPKLDQTKKRSAKKANAVKSECDGAETIESSRRGTDKATIKYEDVKEEKSSMSEVKPPVLKSESDAAQSKVEGSAKLSKKAFSLKGMLEGPKPTATPKDASSFDAQGARKSSSPQWMGGSQSDMDSAHQSERSFAMEFLEDAVSDVPSGRINSGSFTRGLEGAIFQWSINMCRVKKLDVWSSDLYWEKVHDIVAAIAGKREPGSIAQKILDGDFAKASDIMKLKRKDLRKSFMGR